MPMKLFARQAYRRTGSAVVNDGEPVLVLYPEDEMPDFAATFDRLEPGESTYIAPAQWRYTRLPDYHCNSIVWDTHAKEHVLVTNGECVFQHFDGPEAFTESHKPNGHCEYAQSEGIALRPFLQNGKLLLAWTYRALNPCYLQPSRDQERLKVQFQKVLNHHRTSRFIGRI